MLGASLPPQPMPHHRQPGLQTLIYCQQKSLGGREHPWRERQGTLWTVAIGVLCGLWIRVRTALATTEA